MAYCCTLLIKEGEKYRKHPALEKKSIVATKNKGPLKLDWYREPKNMENRFVNYTTLVVNTILLFLSIVFVVLVHTHKVCPPPDFILNSESHEGDRCIFARNSSASLSLDTLHSLNASNTISTHN